MIVNSSLEVLCVGIEETEYVSSLWMPAGFRAVDDARSALRTLRENRDLRCVVCRWDLPGMPAGEFVRRLSRARPGLPIVVLLDDPDVARETEARCAGVAAVLPVGAGREVLRSTVSLALG